ncbi:MAG: Omp28-related outer membrane protein [Bacteroidales bacterium]
MFVYIFTLGLNTMKAQNPSNTFDNPISEKFQYGFTITKSSPIDIKAADSSERIIGYCTEDIELYLSVREPGKGMKAAIQLPSSKLQVYGNKMMTKIRIGAPENHTMSNVSVFISYGKDQTPFYTQKVGVLQDGWNEIALDIPYVINGKEIFVGYTFDYGAGRPIFGFSNNRTDPNGGWIFLGQWMRVSEALPDFAGNHTIQAIVSENDPTKNEIILGSVSATTYVKQGASVDIKASVSNLTSESLKKFDLVYTIDGKNPVNLQITNKDIKRGEAYNFILASVPLSISGKHAIEVSISNPNGNVDENMNNNTKTAYVSVYSDSMPRKVVLEQYTTEGCVNCPGGTKALYSAVNNDTNVLWIANHSGFGVDPYTVNTELLWFYSQPCFAPAAMLDRVPGVPGPVQGVEKITKAALKARIEKPAFVSVNLGGNFDADKNELTIKVSGKSIIPLIGDQIMLNVFLIEDSIVSNTQVGVRGNYIHNHVLRKIISETFGDNIKEQLEQATYMKEYTFSLEKEWKAKNLKVIAFVSNYDYSNPNACEIYNGNQIAVTEFIPADLRLVSLTMNRMDGGTVSGAGYYTVGKQVTINARAKKGFRFQMWKNGNEEVTESAHTFQIGNDNVEYLAIFDKLYTTKLLPSPANGGTVDGGGIHAKGDVITINAQANEGYVFERWMLNGKEVSRNASFPILVDGRDATYYAMFNYVTAIENTQAIAYRIYPNPASDKLTIVGAFSELKIYDLQARLIFATDGKQQTIHVDALNEGAYIMTLKRGNIVSKHKIIINR